MIKSASLITAALAVTVITLSCQLPGKRNIWQTNSGDDRTWW